MSGIASLFQTNSNDGTGSNPTSPPVTDGALPPSQSHQTVTSPSSASSQVEGVFDPPFYNDEPFREQPFVKRMLHFASKHKSDGLLNAMGTHVMSHVEFGGCLADYSGMNARYKKIRALEDVDEVQAIHQGHPPAAHARVRFVNYYTLSSGRPKPPKTGKSSEPGDASKPVEDMSTLSLASPAEAIDSTKQVAPPDKSPPPEYSREDPATIQRESRTDHDAPASISSEPPSAAGNDPAFLSHIDPSPISDDELAPLDEPESSSLHPIPSPPSPPLLPDLTKYTDKETKKQLEKESKRLQKAHAQAMKDHEKALREREKKIQSRQKRLLKDTQKAEKQAQKEHQRLEKEEKKRQAKLAAVEAASPAHKASQKPENKKKLRKFCTLPSKVNGERDQAWVGVYMDGMDEVGAHCGLFFPGPHYEQLVGDVGSRVQVWVHEDLSKRVALRDVATE